MSTPLPTGTLTASPAAVSLRQQAEAFWRGRAPRERHALSAGLVAVVLLAIWMLLLHPAWQTIRGAPAQLDQLDQQLQQMQATATEVAALRAIAPVSQMQAAAALKAATDRLGEHARLSLQGDRASVTLTGVSADSLRSWLNEARSGARARPIEASLSRVAQGYSGTLIMTLGGAQ